MRFWNHVFHPADRSMDLFFCGCNFHCEGCFNEHLQDFEAGRDATPEEIIQELHDYKGIVKRVDIIGGEPTEQPQEEMARLCKLLREGGFTPIVFYTGHFYTPETLKEEWHPAWDYCDYLKYGPYMKDKESYVEPLLGLKLAGNNQKLISLR